MSDSGILISPRPAEDIVAETHRLRLRRFRADEQDVLVRIFGNPEVMRFSLAGARDAEWCARRLEAILRDYRRQGFGLWVVELRVFENGADPVIGYCGLKRWPDVGGRPEVELGYRFLPSSWGHGYGTEAARAARDLGFETFGLSRLVSLIEAENIGSWKIAEKIGMSHERDVEMEGTPVRVYAQHR